MKKEDIVDALNELDGEYLESAQNMRIAHILNRHRHTLFVRAGTAVTALACAVAGILLINKPVTPPEIIDVTPTDTPLPLETVVLPSTGPTTGIGFMVLMYPDYSKETDYNPWTEEMDLQELPVYKRPAHPAGETWGLSEEEIRSRLDRVCGILGLKPEGYTVTKASDNGPPDIPGDAVLSVQAEIEGYWIYADGYGTITIGFNDEISLPENLQFTNETPETEAVKTVQYLGEKYGNLLKETKWEYDLTCDYTFEGNVNRQYHIYGAGETDAESLLNYTYRYIQFAPDEGKLMLIRVYDELAPAEKLGDYPLISKEEAYELLYQGNCISSFNEAPSRDAEIADVQLTYTNFHNYEYQIPYYRFLVDVTGQYGMREQDGLKSYGLYYVPAIEQQYYRWEKAPESEQNISVQEGFDENPEPAELPEELEADGNVQPEITEPEITVQEKIMLDVSQSVQENNYFCGPAILQMILSYHGIASDQNDLARQLHTSSVTGTEYADMARVLNTYLFGCEIPAAHAPGYRVQELVPGSVSSEDMRLLCERIKTDMSTGDPVPLAVDLGALYPELFSANHFVLVVGYKTAPGSNEITDLYVRDPSYKVQDPQWQGLKVFTLSEIRNALNRNTEPAYVW